MYNYLYNIILEKSLRIIILNLFIRILMCAVLLDTIEVFKTKILTWTPKSQLCFANTYHYCCNNKIKYETIEIAMINCNNRY